MKAYPVRSTNRSGDLVGGAGFFAYYKDRLWLVTAAHVALAENDVHARWAEWPDSIGVKVGSGLRLGLFDDQRRPLFAYMAEDEKVADILALQMPPIADNPAFADLVTFDLSAELTVEVGDTITALGYPTEIDDWPQSTAVALDVEVVRLSPGVIEHMPPGENGMSGGPMIDRKQALVGLVMGHNYGTGRVADVAVIRWVIGNCLPLMPIPEWRSE